MMTLEPADVSGGMFLCWVRTCRVHALDITTVTTLPPSFFLFFGPTILPLPLLFIVLNKRNLNAK